MIASELELSSLTLDELLSPSYAPLAAGASDTALGHRRIAQWCEIAAGGDWNILHKRLQRDGLCYEAALARLSGVDRRADQAEPGWVSECDRVRSVLTRGVLETQEGGGKYPFGDLLAPLVSSAISELAAQSPLTNTQLIAESARNNMVEHLWQQVVSICELPLYRCLAEWRGESDQARQRESSVAGFQRFVVYMRETGFQALFASFPPLLRTLAVTLRHWVDAYAAFSRRVERDRCDLVNWDSRLNPNPVLTRLRFGLSDPHNGGHSVLLATFDHDQQLLYKPKSLASDLVVADIVELFNRRGLPLQMKIPPVLNRDGYGWTAFVDPHPCKSEEDVQDFFRRAGSWLAIFHLLCASDIHLENIIASGADPVPVDFETILQGPALKTRAVGVAREAAWLVSAYLERSVLAIGMLPAYVKPEDGTVISVGGLEPSTLPRRQLGWHAMNSLQMRPELCDEVRIITSNLPVLRGEVRTIAPYRHDIIEGFKTTAALAIAFASDLLAIVGSARVDGLLVRRIVRPTRFYDLLLRRLLDHRMMRDSVAWSMQAEFIARLYDWESDADELWEVFATERNALLARDIPVFYVSPKSACDANGRKILNIGDGVGATLARITRLTEESIAEQCRLIAAALQMPQAEAGPRLMERSADDVTLQCSSQPGLAFDVYHHLCARSFKGEESASWLLLEFFDREASAQLVPIGYDLYNGCCGIGIFFAAMARTQADAGAASMARATICDLVATLRSANRGKLARTLGVGGCVGMGSIVYGLATISELLGDAEICAVAELAATTLTDEAIRADVQFDLIGGTAGTCLTLLKLYQITGVATWRDQAIRCADHLEANLPAGRFCWSSPEFDHQPLTGMSHGAAGYALAFSRLFAATGIVRYREIAETCVRFEDSHFNAKQRNWSDLRLNPRTGKPWWPNQWCYGATGIAYARMAMAIDGTLDCEAVSRQVRSAADLTMSTSSYSNDTLCCGMAGQADFLIEAGHFLNDPSLTQGGINRIAAIAERWSNVGDVKWDLGNKNYNLGLFRGIAGIGYTSLRAKYPALPRVLLCA